MKTSLFAFVIVGFFSLGCMPAAARESNDTPLQTARYRDLTGSHELDILMSEELIPGGSLGHSVQSDGDLHDVQLDAASATTRYHVDSPSRLTDYTVTRSGNVLTVQGILAGVAISRTIRITDRPWYEAIERSLHDFVMAYAATGVKKTLTFWVVQPWEAKAYLLQAKPEAQEQISVNGRLLTAIRVRVSPVGLLGLVWSSLYWYRLSDGIFLRYEAVRGGPGTPKSLVEYMGNG